jgi:ribosome maturation factor RimP
MALTDKIERLLGPIAADMGLAIVEATYSGRVLQILLERADGSPPTIDECERASKAFSAHLDVEDPIQEKYMLEVGSAGIARPLLKLSDWKRFIGREAKAELANQPPGCDRKKFTGAIKSVEGSTITLSSDETETSFDFGDVARAKLHVTDDDFKKILKEKKNERKK